jgi:hypothetical protein
LSVLLQNFLSRQAWALGCTTTTTDNRKATVMMYLCIIFIPPVYFLTRKKWLGFILNSILYGIACMFVLTFVFAFVGVIFWILSVGHASFTYKREMLEQHAELMATKMAEKMQNQPPKL